MSYIQPVTSHQNPKIKYIKSLEMRKKRKEYGQFIAEGLKVIGTARECGFKPELLVFEEGTAERGIGNDLVNWALEHRAEVLKVPYDIMEKLSGRDNPQSMMAVFSQLWVDAPQKPQGLWVVLEEVRDPGNLGTIIRTVDAVGAQGIILVGQCCDPYSIEAVRATMGSVFAVPLVKMDLYGNNVDVIVYGEFKDEDAFHAYKNDPLYAQATNTVKPLRETRIAADFDTQKVYKSN